MTREPITVHHQKPADRNNPAELKPDSPAYAVLDGESYHYYRFTAKKNQQFVIDLHASRIESRAYPRREGSRNP